MIEIWNTKIESEKKDKLPIIVPLVVYHGKENWNIKTSLGEIIFGYDELPEDIKEFIPNYKYLLYDISAYSDEEIEGEIINKITF